MTPSHEQCPATYFLRLNNSETFVELVGTRPLHLLSQTVLPLKSPTGAFIAALRFANAVQPQTLLRTDEEELCQFDTIPPTREKTERSRRGTPCCTYRCCLWLLAGCVRVGAPCFFYYASSFSARSIRYPTPTWVWIRCGASGYRSNFLRRDAM